ncbi:hypothetical protein RPQ02_28350 [Streptomyces sp. AM2-3-1]|uniref:hypothetical protein n=1 Tax=Streptomyces sp. AM2-3-1 TaxID=3075824 RepID=UPI0028C3B8A5|nr:hypothetical protein [Streptomyces sp. AM2-3-1]WNO67445.1 hypothetical protein RPQ02_28350 [Streptomyces sp. AM2-3-1]
MSRRSTDLSKCSGSFELAANTAMPIGTAITNWGITDPMIRKMLISNIQQAIRLQREAEIEGGGAASRG